MMLINVVLAILNVALAIVLPVSVATGINLFAAAFCAIGAYDQWVFDRRNK